MSSSRTINQAKPPGPQPSPAFDALALNLLFPPQPLPSDMRQLLARLDQPRS